MPWTMGAFAVGSLGLAGVPPINGFFSKWNIIMGSLDGDMLIPALILIFSGLLNAGYFFPILYRAYFKKGEGLEHHKEASPFMVVPIVITAALSLLFGLFPKSRDRAAVMTMGTTIKGEASLWLYPSSSLPPYLCFLGFSQKAEIGRQ